MAGTTVDYIIRLLRDDSDLKKQLKSTERDISKLNAHERAEVKKTLQTRMDALAATAKSANKNPDSVSMIDLDGLKDEMAFIKEVFKEMKALNPTEDWVKSGKLFVQSFSNMHQQLGDLANSVDALKGSVAELGESFKNVGFDIAPTVDVSNMTKNATKAIKGSGDVIVSQVHGVSKNIQREATKMSKFLTSLGGVKHQKYDFKSASAVTKRLETLRSEYNAGVMEQYGATQQDAALAAQEMIDIMHWVKKMEKDPKSNIGYVSAPISTQDLEDYKKVVDEQISYARQQIERYNEEVQKAHELNLADRITKNLKNLNIRLDLEPKSAFTKKVNDYIDSINTKKLHTIKVKIDDAFDLNKKKKKKTTDAEQEVDDVINESGLARFEAAIAKMQDKTKQKTTAWRGEMLKMLKFKSGDFEFNFGNALMDDLQKYFYEPGHELDILINEEDLKRRIENVIKDSGGVIGSSGSTATLDPKMLASAFYSAIHAALTGKEMPTFDFGDSTTTEAVSDAAEDATESNKKYVKTLSESTIHIDKVVESLRKLSQVSQKSNAGKAVDAWFGGSGIDMSLIRAGATDDEIISMIQDAWMVEDRMGHAEGSTVVDQLNNFFVRYKSLKPETGAGRAISVLQANITELFRMLEIPMETVAEWQKRIGNLQIYEDAAKHGRGLALLNKFRPKLKTSAKAMQDGATVEDLGKIKVEDIEATISYFAKNGWDTKYLEELRDARKALGESADSEQIKAFQAAAIEFYEKSRVIFDFLNKKYGNFAGDIYIQGRKNPIPVQSPKDILNQIPEDAVIVDPHIYGDIGSSRVLDWDDRKSESRSLREQGRQAHQDRKVYEQDILQREIKVKGFSPLETPPSEPIQLDKKIQTLRDKIATLEQEYIDTEAAISKLDKQIEKSSNSVQKQQKLSGSVDIIGRNKIYTKEHDSILNTAADKNKVANVIQDALKANKGFGDRSLAYGDVLPKNMLTNLSKLDDVVQRIYSLNSNLTYISGHSSKEDIDAEIAKLGKDGKYVYNTTYDEKINQLLKERFELYQKIKANNYDPSGVIGRLSGELTTLQTREASLKSKVSTWAQSTTEKSAQQMQTAQNKLKPLIQVFRTEINGLVDEVIDIVSKLNDPNLKGKTRDDLVAKLQNRLQLLQEAEDEYAEFRTKVGNSPESLLNKARKKSVEGLYEQYVINTASVSGTRKEKLDELQESDIKLRTARSELESKKKANEAEREAAQRSVVRLEKQRDYNVLKEQELKLQEQIATLEDGQEKETKATELGNIQVKLASLEKEIDSLGGFVGAGNSKVYTKEQQKEHALESAKQYQLDLITAHEQKRAITTGVADIEKWEKQVNKYGLKAGYGDRAYSQYKQRLVEEFRNKTRASLKEQLGLNDAKFQVEPTLMSEEVYNLKQKLYEALDAQTEAVVDKYKESIHINDKGMLEATEFKWDSDAQEVVESTQIVRDVKQHILNELKNRKDIITGKKAVVDGNLVDTGKDRVKELDELIQYIKAERDKALAYGGLEYDDIKNDDIIREQILYQQKIDELVRKKAAIETDESKDEKTKEKELALLNQEIQDYQRLIVNREKLIELRAKEKEDSKWSAEEKQIYYTDKLIKAKERLKQVNGEISTLEKTMNETITQHGKDSAEAIAAQYAYDKKVESRQAILDTIANANKKLGYINKDLEQSGVSSTGTTKQGGLFGEFAAVIKDALSSISGGTIDVDSSDIATETTLRAIFEMLSGGGQASADLDAEKARGKAERDARRKAEQERAMAVERQKRAERAVDGGSRSQSKTAKQKDRLNAEGQTQFVAIKKAGSDLQKELKDLDKQGILSQMGDQVKKLQSMTKGTAEYLQEQHKLASMVFAYTGKLKDEGVTSHTSKAGTKYLKYDAVLERQEVKALGDVKSLMVSSVKDIADNLIKLGFGAQLGRNKKDPTELDTNPSIDIAQEIEKKMIEAVGKALPLKDIQSIVGNVASNMFSEQGDTSRPLDRDEFYEKNYTAIVDKAFEEALIKRFRHLNQIASDSRRHEFTPESATESDKILQLLTERGVYKGSQKEFVKIEPEMQSGAVADEVKENVAETPAEAQVEPTVGSDAYKKAVETVRGAIGDFDMRSSKTAKAEMYNSLGQEVRDAGNLIFKNLENATREEKALVDKLIKLRDVAIGNKPVEDYTSRQFVADLLKKEFEAQGVRGITEETLNSFAQQLIDTTETDDIATEIKQGIQEAVRDYITVSKYTSPEFVSDLIKSQFSDSGITDISDVQAMDWAQQLIDTIETDDIENEIKTGIQDAITQYKAQVALLDNVEDAETTPQTDKPASSQGGIIGIMRTELAQESTLQKVLNALGEIAKKNAMAGSGKANSAQDLLEQFRRMLESDAWEGRERVAYVDLETGSMSNSITGDEKSISAERLNILRAAYKDVMDLNAQVHTHANEEDPYFSQDDLKLFASDFADGITKQILLSKNNMTVLDMTGVQDVNGLLEALAKTEQNFEALATTADKFGAKYISRAFNEITPQGLVKMLGIKGIESKYTESETRDSAVHGMLEEDAKVAADMLQESTGRAIKKTVERVGAELMTTTEKTDAKGNKIWSKQINDKYTKAALATNKAFTNLGLDKEFGIGTDAQLALVDYQNKYTEFLRLTEEFKKNPKQEGLQAQFDKLLPELDAAEEKLNKLIVSKDRFLGGKEAIKIFEGADLANAGSSLKDLATARYAQNGLNLGDNIAFNGISETPNGTRLLVDVLKDGTIQQYALEVDRATGQVKEFMMAETALANAFQNVNKAMRTNETVMASVAIGDDPVEQATFMNGAHSFGLDAYRDAMAQLEQYVADIWNRMANGGASASKEDLDYIMALSERVIALGKNVQKTSIDFKNFWAQNRDNVFGHTIYHQGGDRDERVREELEKRARSYASANNAEYGFSSFDNDTLQFTLTDAEGSISRVAYQWNELYQQIAMVSDKSTSALDPIVAKINRYDEALQQAVKDGYLMADDSNFDAFYKATDGIRFFVDGIKNGYETFDTTKEKIAELRQEALKYGEQAKQTVAQNKRLFAGTGAKKQVDNQYNKIIGTKQANGEEFASQFADDSPLYQKYIDAYTQLNTKYKEYVDSHALNNPDIQQQIQQQAAQVQLLGRRYLTSVTQAEKLHGLVEQSGTFRDAKTGQERSLGGTTDVTATEVKNLEAKMRDFVENGLKQANIEGVKFDAVNQKLTYTFRTSKNSVADMVVQYNDATKALYAYQKQERESLTGLAGFMQSLKAKTKSILQYTTSITSIYRVWGELRRGVQYIREIDKALTELRKVTDETEETYDRFLKTAAKTADKVGSTIQKVVSSTADWSRLGYSLKDAATLAESTSVLLNVSEFQSIEDATSALTSTLQAFGYTASQSMNVVDVMNEIGNSFAVSSDGIATALQDSASSLMAANNSYEEAVALIASANRVVILRHGL